MRPTVRALVALTAVALLVATACGSDGDDDDSLSSGSATTDGAGEQTVDIDMADNAFEPNTLDVEAGETVRFVFTNTGAVDHDAFIGDATAQAEHEEEMRAAEDAGSGDDMEGMDDEMGSDSTEMGSDDMGSEDEDEHGMTVAPGETGELTHTFTEPGTLEIGCHEPGHYEAGMKVTVTVS